MPEVLSADRHAFRLLRTNRALEAGVARLKPDFAMSRVMDSTGALLALPNDKLVEVLDDLKLTVSRINSRIDQVEG